MSLAITVNAKLTDGRARPVIVRGTVAASSTYATGGDALSLISLPGFPVSKTQPCQVQLWGAGSSGHVYHYKPGADLSAGTMVVTVISTGAEHAAAAYNAGVSGDTIQFEAVFPAFV